MKKGKKKTFVMTFSKEFMKGHPKEGQPTDFVQSIINQDKIHTIRENLYYWNNIVNQVNAGEAVLSCRTWTGKPYRSKQSEFAEFSKLGIQHCFVDEIDKTIKIIPDFREAKRVELNDGLESDDFWHWFKQGAGSYCIIHFTDFRY